jgi:hypothetical protein
VVDVVLPLGLGLAAVVMAALMYLGIVGRLDRWWISAAAALGVLFVASALLAIMPGAVSGARPSARAPEAPAKAEPPPKVETPAKVAEPAPPAKSAAPAPPTVDKETLATVSAMIEVMAEMTALNAARTPRGAPGAASQGPGAVELQAVRDKAEATLRMIGTPEPRVQAIRAAFSGAIMRDLEAMLWRAVQVRLSAGTTPRREREIRLEMTQRLGKSRSGEAVKAVRPYLEELGAWNSEVERRLVRVDEFRRTGQVTSAAGSTPSGSARSGS